MFCTSCGASLGAWPNKSCPRCGAPLRSADETPESDTPENALDQFPASTPSPTAPPSAHYRKNLNPAWLAIVGVFVLIVGGVWWGLGMNNSPIINPKVVNSTQPTEPTRVEQTPDVPPLVTPPPDVLPPVEQTPDVLPLVTPPPDVPPLVTLPPDVPPLVTPPPDVPPRVTPPPDIPPRQPRRTQQAKPLPIPPEWLGTIREELAGCDSFFCHSRVQRKYCDGYWNRIPECKKSGNGL
ncbi:MAG: hypothetical protein LBP86_10930 [Azoarcus sp.]|jgi:hypothetical protein|nr:hypothetical protein [Azoarcus sp.]